MSLITGFFSNTKNILMLILGLFGVGYIGVQKYKAAKAETALKQVETKIAKTNVIVAKTKAKAKAEGKKAETSSHIETLKALKKQSKEIQKEMGEIAKNIKNAKDAKQNTKQKKKFSVVV
jgi:hypothetical protein